MHRSIAATLALVATIASAEQSTVPAATMPPSQPEVVVSQTVLQYFKPLPSRMDWVANPVNEAKIELGRMLFYDPRLSKNHDRSCNSCHELSRYGMDGRKVSTGHKGQLGRRNAPSVYNTGHHVAQFWDGRAVNLEEQVRGPVLSALEMAMPDPQRVIATLKSIPRYVAQFKKAFPGQKDPVTFDNMAFAIAAFERGLLTPSRFDRFLAGDRYALTNEEKRGLIRFHEIGCSVCHDGVSVGGTTFQRLGLARPYPDQSDLGRYTVTRQPWDWMAFRVPSLRNVAKTGPWFHNGSITELETVVRTMAYHQLGRYVSDEDVRLVITFLGSLTGELPTRYIAKPTLPPSTPRTPKPDPS